MTMIGTGAAALHTQSKHTAEQTPKIYCAAECRHSITKEGV